ncbi:MAG: TetR/AcrR family transcriptional regulator [Eubacteriales bacterium]|nr:TetR/AcrR family transcriptional regulator [Christensenellaceae bacterium]MDY3241986.1 TetR/AcrR family transcriptional regulator [Eubacteriales bacterium]
MPRKPMYDGGTANKMTEVAAKMFFENGYEGTSVRSIVKETGCEVGLFYYYFKNKDELFSAVIENFFAPYEKEAERIVKSVEKNPDKGLLHFFEYMKKEVRVFRGTYAKNMHKTVRLAIREQTLNNIEPYIERIIVALIKDGANPVADVKTSAVFLSHGVGSIILHEDSEWVDTVSDELRRAVNKLMGLSPEKAKLMFAEKK